MTLTQKSIEMNLTAEELMKDIFEELEAGDYETLQDTIEVNRPYCTFDSADIDAINQKIEAVRQHQEEVDELLNDYRHGEYESPEEMIACNEWLTKNDRNYIDRVIDSICIEAYMAEERARARYADMAYETQRDLRLA